MRALPELVTMVKGMAIACRAVLSVLLMLVLLVYVFSIVMHSFLKENGQLSMYWSTISESMWTLLLNCVFLDALSDRVRELVDENEIVALCVLLLFVLISSITVMNMLIGVLCEVVCQVASAEKELTARNQVKSTLLGMLRGLDADGSGDITKDELLGVLANPEAITILNELEVDIPHFMEIQDMVYDGPEAVLSISQIMSMILDNRGDRQTTLQDLVNGLNFSRWSLNLQMEKQTEMLRDHMEQLVGNLAQQLNTKRQTQLESSRNGQIFERLQNWMTTGS